MDVDDERRGRVTSGLWYRAALVDERVAGQVVSIREQFVEALTAAGWPDGACLFATSRGRRGEGAGEEPAADMEALYFSPASISAMPHLIALCGAVPSPPPERAHATLLVGKESDWDLLPRLTH